MRTGAVALALLCLVAASGVRAQFATVLEAVQQGGNFNILAQVVALANATALLSDPDLQAIVLAPTDTAFTNTLANFPGADQFASNPEAAASVLGYHVIPTSSPNAELVFSDGVSIAETAITGELPETTSSLTFKNLGGNLAYVGGLAPGSTLLLNNTITAGKSIIYVLQDGLVIPPSKSLALDPEQPLTILEALNANADLSLLAGVINGDETLAALVSDPTTAVTVFAPTNDAFTALLIGQNITDPQSLIGSQQVRDLVLTHVIASRPYTSRQLPSGSVTLPTANPTQSLTITADDDTVTVGVAESPAPAADVTQADIKAGLSVIHVISSVLVPVTTGGPTPSTPSPSATTPTPSPTATTPTPSPTATTPSPSPSTPTPTAQPPAVTNTTSPSPAPARPDYPNLPAALTGLNLTGLSSLLRDARLDASLLSLPLTLFAPSNEAVARAQADAVAENVTVTPQLVTGILAYHVVPFVVNGTFVDNQVLPTLIGNLTAQYPNSTTTLTVRGVQNATNIFYLGGVQPGATFNASQRVTAGSAVVYIIDDVLVPPGPLLGYPRSIAELLNRTDGFSTLAAVIKADPALQALANSTDAAVTVFAPTDAAFQAFFNTTGLTASAILGTTIAQRIVLNHVVPSFPYTAGDLPLGTTTGVETGSTGDFLAFTKNVTGTNVTVTVQGAGNVSPIKVVAANVDAGKSVVHVIDGVILPNLSSPPPAGTRALAPTPSAATTSQVSVFSTLLLAAAMLVGVLAM